ncbi:MAG: O-antigen ligase family protein [Magnetococcales bacterium]|nr:O-antigen ligase family protein [Magnetococcales bacterium]
MMRSVPAQRRPIPPKQTLTLGIRYAGVYFFLIFAIWPLARDIMTEGSLPSRFPLLVGAIMLAVSIKEGGKLGYINVPIKFFALFGVFYVLSSTYGPNAPGLVEGIISLMRSIGLGVALVLAIRSVADLQFFFKIFVWYGVASTCYGLLFMVPGLTGIGEALVAMHLSPGKIPNAMRMVGFLSDPTYFGLSIMPALLINVHSMLGSTTKKVARSTDWLAVSMTVVLLLGLLLSFSRTSWIGAAAGILILTGFQGQTVRALFFFFVILVFVQVVAPDDLLEAALSANKERTTFEINERNDSRSGIWEAYFNLATENPWGYGMDSIEYLRLLPYTFSGSWTGSGVRPHNMYLYIWVEAGLQTLIPFLLLLGSGFVYAWRIRNYVDPNNGMSYGMLSMALLLSMSIGMFGLGGMLQLLSIAVAVGLAICSLAAEGKLVHISRLLPKQNPWHGRR